MKYLIEIHHGIGDIVQMTGVIESIVKADTNAYIALIINKDSYKSLFECDDRVKKFYRIDFKGMTKFQIIFEVLKMRKEHFDYLLVSPISNKKYSQVLAKMINAKCSVGEQLVDKGLKNRHVEFEDVHIVKRNENIYKKLNISDMVFMPKLNVSEITIPINIEKEAIALCIGTSITQKTWNINNYIKLAEYLIKMGKQVIILGGKKEQDMLTTVNIPENCINMTGKLSLIQSAKVASLCNLVVGGDTGVMHIAAAVDTMTLTLFSCTSPYLHSPYSNKSYFYKIELPCQFCYENGKENECSDYKCINQIEFEKVKEIVDSILENKVDLKYKYMIKKG